MDQYDKGEVQVTENNDGFNAGENTLKMRVNYGSKVGNLVSYAQKKFDVSSNF